MLRCEGSGRPGGLGRRPGCRGDCLLRSKYLGRSQLGSGGGCQRGSSS